jgi:hypothetical protein
LFNIDRLLRVTAASALLPLIAVASPALAGSPRTSSAQAAHLFGDPDSGGEVRPHWHLGRMLLTAAPLAEKGDGTVVHGPVGRKPPTAPTVVRPEMLAADDGPVITGPGGTRPPIRPSVFEPTKLAGDGPPIIRGAGGAGGRPPSRLRVVEMVAAA